MKFLLGTHAYNAHIKHIALALYEDDILGAYYTGLVDHYHSAVGKNTRSFIKKFISPLDKKLVQRKILDIPEMLIHKVWPWELLCLFSRKLGLNRIMQDKLWEYSEFSLDRICATLIRRADYNGFIGVEHGCLLSLKIAKEFNKKTVLTYLSPHHTFYQKWVQTEYANFPELYTSTDKRLFFLSQFRNKRRDEETHTADVILTNSNLVTNSLITAGFAQNKIVTVSLGCPDAISKSQLPGFLSQRLKFIYAGCISVAKGAHYLIEAWKILNAPSNVELHFYGSMQLSKTYAQINQKNVFFHGQVSQVELFQAFRFSLALIFPTLCDGFGLVIGEALSQGLPVITTTNAGGADLIDNEKNGFIVLPKNAEDLAKKIEWCIRHPQDVYGMREHALATANRMSWEKFRLIFRQKVRPFL